MKPNTFFAGCLVKKQHLSNLLECLRFQDIDLISNFHMTLLYFGSSLDLFTEEIKCALKSMNKIEMIGYNLVNFGKNLVIQPIFTHDCHTVLNDCIDKYEKGRKSPFLHITIAKFKNQDAVKKFIKKYESEIKLNIEFSCIDVVEIDHSLNLYTSLNLLN